MKNEPTLLPEEMSDFIPEVAPDPLTGKMIDVATGKPARDTFVQKPYEPMTEYQG